MRLIDLLTSLAALAAVVALIFLVRRGGDVLNKVRGRSPSGNILSVKETLFLDQRHRLTLVECDGRRVLLLTGGSSDVVVGWLPSGSAPVSISEDRGGCEL
jgi:flagellar biogenesis protein FliO